jgi:hypothetical protein
MKIRYPYLTKVERDLIIGRSYDRFDFRIPRCLKSLERRVLVPSLQGVI